VSVSLLRITVLASVLAATAPEVVQAQIHAWRDPNGRLVVSDQPAPGDAASVQTFAVQNGGRTDGESIRTTRGGKRSEAFDPFIEEHATSHGISPNLVRALIQVESAFNPRAVSVKGAMGLMQLMPATAAEYGVQNPFDPEQNIRGGVAYLKWLLDRFDQKPELALAAYNAGPGAVARYGQQIPPYRETRDYVRKIKSVTEITVGPRRKIYKIVELIEGREVPRYSDKKPAGDYELITR
jgi:soluble lytic murein transglycosylase-like protein